MRITMKPSKNNEKLYAMSFKSIYDLYLNKVTRKGQSEEDLRAILQWLLGLNDEAFENVLQEELSLKELFTEKAALHPHKDLVKGSICGIKIEEIEDPLMKDIRIMDKVVDELAKGKSKDKIMR